MKQIDWRRVKLVAMMVALTALPRADAFAAIVVFNNDLAGFNAAAGSPPVAIDFDSIAAGTNISGSTILGVTFTSPPANPLEVVTAVSTFTPPGFAPPGDSDNRLFATSGANVLSPGGPALVPGFGTGMDLPVEQNDDLTLIFASPLRSFGLDLLFQSLDGASFVGYTIFDSGNVILASDGFIPIPANPNGPDPTSPSAAGGGIFLGFVSDSANIARIEFVEFDENNGNPDANIGYDTFRFDVPEPGTLMLVGLGLIGFAATRRRD